MARARNIKPGFFKNEVLAEMPCEARLLFIGLWTLADREGRLEDRPKRIRAELFAFDGFDVESMLAELQSKAFLIRYEADGVRYIQIENFVKHQDPHYKEKASEIPPPPGGSNLVLATGVTRTQRARILERDGFVCLSCGSKEHLCIDHVLPVSRGGDSSDDNLQTLCLSCNTKKGNKLDGETRNTSRKGQDQLPDPDGSNVDSTSTRPQVKPRASVPLNPDSGFSDSLIPDSLIPDPGFSDSLNSDLSDPPPAEDVPRRAKPKAEPKTGPVWQAYSRAYSDRYGAQPVRNATVNGQLAQLVNRLGDEAEFVAEFYLTHRNRYYVEKMHPVGLLLSDAEKLRTEWATGRQTTATQASQADKTQTNLSAFAPLFAEAQAKEQIHAKRQPS